MDGVQCMSRTYENIKATDCLLYRTTYDYTKYVEFLRSSLCNYQNSVATHNHQFSSYFTILHALVNRDSIKP